MKAYPSVILFILLANLPGAYASADTARKPLSDITVADLKLGTTVGEFKQSNPKAEFKKIDKQGLFHHLGFSTTKTETQGKSKTVLYADSAGYIYWIEYSKFYSEPINGSQTREQLYEVYGEPVALYYKGNLSTYCWHGCLPSRTLNTYNVDSLMIYTRQPRFLTTILGYSPETIQEFTARKLLDHLKNGWLQYQLIDGAREEDVEKDWETRVTELHSKKIDISPN